ncbi:MAG: phosphatidate cytidylyltransferase [Gemmatimonadales bacterium]
MVRRVAFAAMAIPLLVVITWAGAWPLAILLAAVAMLGTGELFDLATRDGILPLRGLGRVMAALVPFTLLASISFPDVWLTRQWSYLLLLALLVVAGGAVFTRSLAQRPLSAVAVTLFGVTYAAVLPSMAFVIRHAQWGARSWAGTALLFFPLIVIWVCDSAAMFGGRLVGGPKLAPTISPGKTWAGAAAGVLGGSAIGAGYALAVFPRVGIPLGVAPAAVLALILTVVGQVGDLVESLLKREAGVKDSSSLIPGHGGVLDRLDSLYFALPVAAAGYHLLGLL